MSTVGHAALDTLSCTTGQESAKYAYELFQGTVKLFGRQVRVGFSPQGARFGQVVYERA